jgi:hypothetical protein
MHSVEFSRPGKFLGSVTGGGDAETALRRRENNRSRSIEE